MPDSANPGVGVRATRVVLVMLGVLTAATGAVLVLGRDVLRSLHGASPR